MFRRTVFIAIALAVGFVFIGCSDDSENGTASEAAPRNPAFPTTTSNFDDAADTEFCDAYVSTLLLFGDGMNNVAVGGSSERGETLLEEYKMSFDSAVDAAPDNVKADIEAANSFIQQSTTWPELLDLSDDQLAVVARLNTQVNTACGLTLASPGTLSG